MNDLPVFSHFPSNKTIIGIDKVIVDTSLTCKNVSKISAQFRFTMKAS